MTDQILVTLPRKGGGSLPFLNYPAPHQTIPFRACNLRMVYHPDELVQQRQEADRRSMTPPRTPPREALGVSLHADPAKCEAEEAAGAAVGYEREAAAAAPPPPIAAAPPAAGSDPPTPPSPAHPTPHPDQQE